MTITTYSELQGAVADWLERADLTNRITDFISLAEAQIKRRLRVSRMMARTSSTVSAAYVSLPTRFIEAVSIVLTDGSTQWQPDPAPQAVLDGMSSVIGTGKPRFWAIVGNQLRYFPTPDASYTASVTYYQAPEPLSDDVASNWVLEEFPDVYLFGALKEAGPFLKDADLLTMFEAKFEAGIEAIRRHYRTQVGLLRNDQLMELNHAYDGSDLFTGSGSTPTPEPTEDDTPTQFTFTALTGRPTLTLVSSNTIQITGIDAGVELPVSLTATGLSGVRGYSKNDGDLTTVDGFAVLNDTFGLQMTTGSDPAETYSMTLTVGSVSATWTVTTEAADDYSPSLDFSDSRNSMYLPLIAA